MTELLATLAELKARLGDTTLSDAALTDVLESVSDEIEEYAGMWLAPRPTDPAAETTLLFDVERSAGAILLTSGGRRVGVRSVSAVGYATSSQPDSGGSYTSILSSVVLRPRPTSDEPASRLVFLSPSAYFYRGFSTLQVTGSFGPAAVAPRHREKAIELAMFDIANGRAATATERLGDWSVSTGGATGRQQILNGVGGYFAI